jgi:excisionase family DNA binding protein
MREQPHRWPGAEDQLLTPTEAAQYLRTTRNTVYRWLRAGTLPAIKIGGAWRISKDALETRSRPAVTPDAASVQGLPSLDWSQVLDRILEQESGHWLVVTSTPEDVLDVESSFLRRGLESGYRVVKGSWWQDSDQARGSLAARGIDVEALERSGALVIMDMAAHYRRADVAGVVAEWESILDGTSRLGLRGLWKTGSPVLDDRVPFDGVARVEVAAAHFFKRPGVYAICPVFTSSDHPQWHVRLMRLLGEHEAVVYRSAERAVLLRPAA